MRSPVSNFLREPVAEMSAEQSSAADRDRPGRRPKVMHLIPLLDQGGAEAMLANLVRATGACVEHRIATLVATANFFGIDPALITSPSSARRQPSLAMVSHLRAVARDFEPDIIHCWMYHANLAVLALPRRRRAVIWSIHSTHLGEAISKPRTRLVDRLCRRLSHRVPDRIVYVAQSARDHHEGLGYRRDIGVVIPTAVDLARFDPRRFPERPPGAGIARPAVIAMVARYGLEKGHHFLIDALASHPERARIALVLVGRDCDTAPELSRHLEATGLAGQTRRMGPVIDIERIYAGADILVLPSHSEAMPLTAIEARAMGAIVCASRVGDVPTLGIAGELMFPPRDTAALQTALSRAIARAGERRTAASAEGDPVIARFDIRSVAARYVELYEDLMRG